MAVVRDRRGGELRGADLQADESLRVLATPAGPWSRARDRERAALALELLHLRLGVVQLELRRALRLAPEREVALVERHARRLLDFSSSSRPRARARREAEAAARRKRAGGRRRARPARPARVRCGDGSDRRLGNRCGRGDGGDAGRGGRGRGGRGRGGLGQRRSQQVDELDVRVGLEVRHRDGEDLLDRLGDELDVRLGRDRLGRVVLNELDGCGRIELERLLLDLGRVLDGLGLRLLLAAERELLLPDRGLLGLVGLHDGFDGLGGRRVLLLLLAADEVGQLDLFLPVDHGLALRHAKSGAQRLERLRRLLGLGVRGARVVVRALEHSEQLVGTR